MCAYLFNDFACGLEDNTRKNDVIREPHICTKVVGVISEVMAFAATTTFKTPKQKVRERMKSMG